jgi:voltage-gated sodium channel
MQPTSSGVSSLTEGEIEVSRTTEAMVESHRHRNGIGTVQTIFSSRLSALSSIAGDIARATRGGSMPGELGIQSLSADSVKVHAMRNSGLSRDSVFDSGLHSEGSVRSRAWSIVRSPWFDTFIGAVVILNAVCIGVEIQISIKGDVPGALRLMDIGFLCVYTFEMMLRIVAEGSRMCTRPSFLFDGALVITGIVAQMAELFGSDGYAVIEHLLIFRSLRIFRVVRAVRVLDFFHDLWKLFSGLLQSTRIVLAAFILIFLVMYIFACLGVEMITKSRTLNEAPETRLLVEDNFDTIFSFMLTLIQVANADSIGSIFLPIVRQEPFLAAYFVALVMVVTTLCMNLVTAAIVDSVLRTGKDDKNLTSQRIRAQTKRYVPVLKRVFQSLDSGGEGMLRYEDLEGSIAEIRELNLPRSLARVLEPSTLQYAFELMDDDGDGRVNLTEFVRGVFGLAYTELPLETTHMLELLRRQSRCVHELVQQGEAMIASVNDIVERLDEPRRSNEGLLRARGPGAPRP